MAQENHACDPRGLIREAYRIEGIGPAEARTIFLDWALTRHESPGEKDQIAALLAAFGAEAPDHPMSAVLREGLEAPALGAGRRGGSRGRRG